VFIYLKISDYVGYLMCMACDANMLVFFFAHSCIIYWKLIQKVSVGIWEDLHNSFLLFILH